jgi:hypothetical protein
MYCNCYIERLLEDEDHCSLWSNLSSGDRIVSIYHDVVGIVDRQSSSVRITFKSGNSEILCSCLFMWYYSHMRANDLIHK